MGPITLLVNTANGVRAGVRVGDLLCARAEVLTERKTAGAHLRVPCPVNYYPVFKDCDEARAAGASDIPKGSPLYRRSLDADKDNVACDTESSPLPVAPAPPVMESHLPVTH